MKKSQKKFLIVVCAVFFLMIVIGIFKFDNRSENIEIRHNSSYINYTKKIETYSVNENLSKIIDIVVFVSKNYSYKREYPSLWDCTQYSELVVSELKKESFNATCIYGLYLTNLTTKNSIFVKKVPHTWVMVNLEGTGIENKYGLNETMFIEAVEGWIIPIEEYEDKYEEKVRGKCL